MKEYKCANCEITFRPKHYPKPTKSGLNFCCRKCSVIYWGEHRKKSGPDPKYGHTCKTCDTRILKKSVYCKVCLPKQFMAQHKKRKSNEAIDLEKPISTFTYSSGNPTNRYARIREHSRRFALAAVQVHQCLICGYDKFVEVCHIKAVKDFDPTTPLKIVNALENLTILCSNHHKEFDRGLIQEVPKIKGE